MELVMITIAYGIWTVTAALYIGMAWPTESDSYRDLLARKRHWVA